MAVVIQEMIPADSAGVMFTTFPTNGDPHKMMITANWGLGQTVVGGQVNPDTHLIKRDYRDGLTVLASKMGDKKITCQMDDIDIAKEIPTDEKKQTVYCLNEGLILKLARVGIILGLSTHYMMLYQKLKFDLYCFQKNSTVRHAT
jgi:phosphoenolpyruvate synthase/pyruvate phosphate dikinase